MSNRIWESAAAGAVIITDKNEFITRHFGNSVIAVENRGDQEETFNQIYEAYLWILKNPENAHKMAINAQKIYLAS